MMYFDHNGEKLSNKCPKDHVFVDNFEKMNQFVDKLQVTVVPCKLFRASKLKTFGN